MQKIEIYESGDILYLVVDGDLSQAYGVEPELDLNQPSEGAKFDRKQLSEDAAHLLAGDNSEWEYGSMDLTQADGKGGLLGIKEAPFASYTLEGGLVLHGDGELRERAMDYLLTEAMEQDASCARLGDYITRMADLQGELEADRRAASEEEDTEDLKAAAYELAVVHFAALKRGDLKGDHAFAVSELGGFLSVVATFIGRLVQVADAGDAEAGQTKGHQEAQKLLKEMADTL